jgi:hypothetical protein
MRGTSYSQFISRVSEPKVLSGQEDVRVVSGVVPQQDGRKAASRSSPSFEFMETQLTSTSICATCTSACLNS